jgi:hypothetical protein
LCRDAFEHASTKTKQKEKKKKTHTPEKKLFAEKGNLIS